MIITFDTGFLIALERRDRRAFRILEAAKRRLEPPVVPAAVCVEWWRGRTDVRDAILRMVELEGMSTSLCRAAGEALGAVKGSTLVDAIVMASAALRGGGIVYTSDVDDLRRLQMYFSTVNVLPI